MLQRIVAVERHEIGALLASFAYFFCQLCGYYILRPARDEMGITDKLQNLPWLLSGTFITMRRSNRYLQIGSGITNVLGRAAVNKGGSAVATCSAGWFTENHVREICDGYE